MESASRTIAVHEAMQIAQQHHQAGRLKDAEDMYRKVLAAQPDHVVALNNLAAVLREARRFAEAEPVLRRALAIRSDIAEVHHNLGNALVDLGQFGEAERCYRQALVLRPDFPETCNELAVMLEKLGRLQEAEDSYRSALRLRPGYAEVHNNLGNVLKVRGRIAESVRSHRQALALNPSLAEAHSNLIFTLDLMEGCTVEEQQAERRRWYEQHGRKHATAIRPHGNAPDPERRLRVGYVSADFRRHSASYVFAPVMLRHDRAGFDVIVYASVKNEDEVTDRLRAAAQGWCNALGMSDEAVAEQIRADGIDILVDLSGHSAGNRLLVFARKPAPVQVTAWGHATGTGMDTMDYFLADPVLVPKAERALYAEEVVDLPCCLCYEPPEYLPPVSPLPVLSGRPFTFGCINRIEKISDRAIGLWARILAQTPGAVLFLKDRGTRDPCLLDRLKQAGIGPERLRLAEITPQAEHLKAYNEVDLGLDPYPHGGGVSTLEALWMGVPVVSLWGTTPTSRNGAAIHTALAMPEWIAKSDDEYVGVALAAARDLERLGSMRQGLRQRMKSSLIGDTVQYTRAVEIAFRNFWRRWCASHSTAA